MVPNNNQVLAQAQPETSPNGQWDLSAAKAFTKASSSVKKQAVLLSGNQDNGTRIWSSFGQPAPAQSGETVSVGPLTLPATKSVTVTFSVMVDALGAGEFRTRILNQGNVTYTGAPAAGINTTDPSPT